MVRLFESARRYIIKTNKIIKKIKKIIYKTNLIIVKLT